VGDDLDLRLSQVSTSEDTDQLIDLGCDLADAERLPDAERCFRRAASLGSAVAEFNLGNTLADLGHPAEAVAAYQRALAGGETAAWLNLGHALADLGDRVGAMRAFREAAGEGNPTAAAVLTSWEWNETLDPALEPALRAGADLYPSARVDLAHLLLETGRIDEARTVLERGAKLGEVESWLPLGNLYADEFGDTAAAETAYRGGIAAGDTYCHHNLGVLLLERGAGEPAREQFRLGAAAGDALAARALRNLIGH
jgi:tetratricopeptide (TPR) repeat protein